MATSTPRKIAFAGLLTAAFFGLAEAAVRLSGVVQGAVYASPGGLTWAMTANMPNSPITTGEGMIFRVATNSLGLRTPYEPGPAQGDTRSMIVLGDSIIFGWGVGNEGSLPEQLEDHLQRNLPSPRWRVINGGQPGYSAAQSLMLLRELGLQYEPDLVFLELAGHNLRYSERSDLELINGTSSAVAEHLSRLHLFRLAKRAIRPDVASREAFWQEGDGMWGQGKGEDPADRRVPARDLETILQELGRLGEEHRFTAVVSQPAFMRKLDQTYLDTLQAAHDRGDVVWLDCGQAISNAGLNNRRWFVDTSHWNVEGAQQAAVLMAQCLYDAGLLTD